MRPMLRVVTTLLALVSVVIATEAAPLQPTIVGWERYFDVQWQPVTRGNRPVLSGYVLNNWGTPAARVSLLVEGVGPNGEIVGQQIAWLNSRDHLMPGGRVYFEVSPAQPAPSYRVSVFAFDWLHFHGP